MPQRLKKFGIYMIIFLPIKLAFDIFISAQVVNLPYLVSLFLIAIIFSGIAASTSIFHQRQQK